MAHETLVDAALAGPGFNPLPVVRYGASVRVAIGIVSTQSPTINARVITITPTVDCFYAVGMDPVAADDDGSDFLPKGKKFSLAITPGHKVAVIAAGSSDGALFILPALGVAS